MELNSIEEVVEDLKKGKCVVIMDDENRENEGDVICAAEFATTENVNFMASYAKGLICMPMAPEYTSATDVYYKYRQSLHRIFRIGRSCEYDNWYLSL